MRCFVLLVFLIGMLSSLYVATKSNDKAKDVKSSRSAKRSKKKRSRTRKERKKIEEKKEEQEEASKIVASAEAPKYSEKTFYEKRRKEVKAFVNKAVEYLEKNDLGVALNAFSHSKEFLDGELYIFVYDSNGVCLSIGRFQDIIWKNMNDYRDVFGNYVIRKIVNKGNAGKGWLTYEWKNTTKVSYVKGVIKNGRRLTIGSGFYPISKRDAVISLVKGASEHFRLEVEKGESPASVFSEMSYPLGRYKRGNLYLYALSFEGKIMAQGDRPGLIGQNAIRFKSNRDIVNSLKASAAGGVWVDYTSKRAKKMAYAEKLTDKKGNHYFVACGYYPDANKGQAEELVKRGYTYMKTNGISKAGQAFSTKEDNDFRYGDLWLFVYDYKGKCIANGDNPDRVGTPRFDEKDDDGRYYVREFIEKGKAGGGWMSHRMNNGYRFVYVEPVKMGAQEFVIGCALFPISKPETVQLMTKGAASLLTKETNEKAFGEYVKRGGKFIKGDLEVFAFDYQGICYADGTDYKHIWKNLFTATDDDGRPFVKLFLNTAKEGPGDVIFRKNGRLKKAYVVKVEKAGGPFVVGSSFFIE